MHVNVKINNYKWRKIKGDIDLCVQCNSKQVNWGTLLNMKRIITSYHALKRGMEATQ